MKKEMSAFDYSALPDADFTFGNSDQIHAKVKAALIGETNPAISNFLVANSTSQTITTQLDYAPNAGSGYADDTDDSDTKLCRKKWVKGRFLNTLLPAAQVSWSGGQVFTGDVRCQQDPANANSLVRKSYADATYASLAGANEFGGQARFDAGIVLPASQTIQLNSGANILCNVAGKTISDTEISFLDGCVSNLQAQINGKVSTSSAATLSGLTVTGNTVLNNLNVSGAIVFPSVSLSEGEVAALTTDLAGKQAVISSTTDLSFRNLDLSGTFTVPNGAVADAALASTFVKPSTAPTLTGTNFTGIPDGALSSSFVHTSTNESISGIKTFVSPPVMSGASLSAGTVADAALSSTFVKPSTAPTLTGTNFTGIPDGALSSTFVKPSTAPVLTGTNFTGIPDGALSSTFVKPSTAPILTGTNFTGIPDGALSSTFVKPSTAPILTGTNFTGIPTSAISSGPLTVTSLTCSSETDSGNITAGSISEKYTSIGNNGTANSYTLDYTSNTAVYILSTAPTANMTIRLNNCGTDTSKNITFAIIYNITSGGYFGNTVSCYSDTSTAITLASSTPLWANATAPSITTSTLVVQTFTLIRNFASNYVMSSVVAYA